MRSMLYVPASNAGNVLNSPYMGADGIVLECEDAVSYQEKDAARIMARNAIRALRYGCKVLVRMNDLHTPFWQDDLDFIVPAKPDYMILPKASSGDYVRKCDDYMTEVEKKHGITVGTVGIMCIIETAKSLENAFEICSASPRVKGVLFGAGDLALDMSITRTAEGREIAYGRSRVLAAAYAAGVESYDTPYMYGNDLEGAERDARYSKQIGFTGMCVVFPQLIDIVNKVFSPSEKEIERALEIMDALEEAKAQGKGVVQVNGEMIDGPIVVRAQKTLALAEQLKGGGIL